MEHNAPPLSDPQTIMRSDSTPRTAGLMRVAVIAAILIAAMLAAHFTPISSWLDNAQKLRTTLQRSGLWAYPLSVIAVAVLVACGTPRLLISFAGGAVFGFWLGITITLAGTMMGHYSVFLFVRWGGREWILRRWPKLQKWAAMIHEQGIAAVFFIRLLPGHSIFANVCLALSHVKHRDFLIGTALGLIPEAIPATLVGAGLVKPSAIDSAGYLALAALVVAGVWIASTYALRMMRDGRLNAEEQITEGMK